MICMASSYFRFNLELIRTSRLQFCREGQQRDVARPLDCFSQPPLVARARAGHAARQNFPSLLNERLEHLDLFVVNEVHALDAETANLLLAEKLALAAAARASGSTTRPTGTAAFTGPASPSTAAISFTALAASTRVPFGAVAATSGMTFAARRAGSSGRCTRGCGWCFL
jgi:hypothetical protein